jgi:hypothetical protein
VAAPEPLAQAVPARLPATAGKRPGTVFQAGLNNLTQDQTTGLAHFVKKRTQQMVLVRLEEPKDGMKDRVSVRQAGSAAGHRPQRRVP